MPATLLFDFREVQRLDVTWMQDETQGQCHVRQVAPHAGAAKSVSLQESQNSFATHLLEGTYRIGTVQELLGQAGARATMILTQVLSRGRRGVCSLRDAL